jgi:hypothetical protein
MAIKGKSKAKNRSKPVARAPRREPVVVKPPLFQRRWVQVVAACIVGAFAAMVVVWVTNGLRQNDADTTAADAASTRFAAAQAWQREVTTDVGKAGTVQPDGTPPVLFAEMNAAIDALKKDGTAPASAAATFATASKSASAAADAMTAFDLTGAIANQGFDALGALAYSDSRDGIVSALALYGTAADLAKLATEASGAQKAALIKLADAQRGRANTQFLLAWNRYTEALRAGGINTGIPGSGSGLGG